MGSRYTHCRATDKAFALTHADIWDYWVAMEAAGQFQPILKELGSPEAAGLKFSYGVGQQVLLNYQSPPPPGFRTGRYINHASRGDVVDEHEPVRAQCALLRVPSLSCACVCVYDCVCVRGMCLFAQAPVLMRDGREISPPASLPSHGFALVHSCSAVSDWQDEEHVKSQYLFPQRIRPFSI